MSSERHFEGASALEDSSSTIDKRHINNDSEVIAALQPMDNKFDDELSDVRVKGPCSRGNDGLGMIGCLLYTSPSPRDS